MKGIRFLIDEKGRKVAVRSISLSMASYGKTSAILSSLGSVFTNRASRGNR
jgi:hypothetical protein